MTLHAGYAASRISSNLKGSTKQFGWLQALATIRIDKTSLMEQINESLDGWTVETYISPHCLPAFYQRSR